MLFPYLRQTFHEMLLHGGLPVSSFLL
ncbi:MAG: hypothetical protein HS115_18530 [Spirochaetales bacterium]|nr:hypothetical protein [Spirochaetales bacterium]